MTVELLSPMAAVPLEDHHDMMARFAPISLDELNNAAALQTRTDRKYLLTWEQFQTLLPQLNHCRVLEIDGRRWFRYRSMYFDTPSLASYLGAAHGSPRRFKVRTRTYVDSGECYIEAKLRNRRGQTVKSRQVHRGPDETIDDADRTFLNGFEPLRPFVEHLRPSLATNYERATLLAPDGSRVTIDINLLCEFGSAEAHASNRVIIESKSASGVGSIDRLLWNMGIRPEPMSKYACGLAAIRPELPSNKWHRVIDRHISQ